MYFWYICLRASWQRESNPEAEQLFSMVAEVFIFWAKSHVRMTHNIVFIFLLMSINRYLILSTVLFFASVFATEFQMGGTELCGPKWNQQLGFLGQQCQNVQGQPNSLLTSFLHWCARAVFRYIISGFMIIIVFWKYIPMFIYLNGFSKLS